MPHNRPPRRAFQWKIRHYSTRYRNPKTTGSCKTLDSAMDCVNALMSMQEEWSIGTNSQGITVHYTKGKDRDGNNCDAYVYEPTKKV